MLALKPLLVPVDKRQAANATLSMLQTGSSVAGPAFGGLTVAALGAPAGFAVNAASFLASMAAALLLRVRAERGPRASMLRELADGWRAVSSAWETAIQDNVPHRALGRVGSWDTLTSFIAMPVGNVLAAPLSQAYGTDRVLTVCAGVLFTSALSQLFIPGTRRLTRATPRQAEPPTPSRPEQPHHQKPDRTELRLDLRSTLISRGTRTRTRGCGTGTAAGSVARCAERGR